MFFVGQKLHFLVNREYIHLYITSTIICLTRNYTLNKENAKITQLLSQPTYVVSYEWWNKICGFIWVHNFTTYNSPRE